MKIAFFVTGFGYGDSIRTHAIIRELLKEHSKTEIMIFCYGVSYEYFKDAFKTYKIKGYKFPDKVFGFKLFRFLLKNLFLPLYWSNFSSDIYYALKEFNPDLIVNDFELLGPLMAKKIGKKCVSIFAFDPEKYKEYPNKSLILNLQSKFINHIYNLSDKVVIASYKTKTEGKFNYVKPIIRMQPEEISSESHLMRKLGFKKKPVIVMLGGSNYGNSLAKALFKLRENFGEEFLFFGSKISLPKSHFKFKENFLEYLKISKGVITLAGNLTMSECMVFRKPMLVFPIKNHVEQLLNVYILKDYLEFGDINNIELSLNLFFKNLDKIRRNIEKEGIYGFGAVEVVEVVEETLREN